MNGLLDLDPAIWVSEDLGFSKINENMEDEDLLALCSENILNLIDDKAILDVDAPERAALMQSVNQFISCAPSAPLERMPSVLHVMAVVAEKGLELADSSQVFMAVWKVYVPLIKTHGEGLPSSCPAANRLFDVLLCYSQDGIDNFVKYNADDDAAMVESNAKLLWLFLNRLAATVLFVHPIRSDSALVAKGITVVLAFYGMLHFRTEDLSVLRGSCQQTLLRLLPNLADPLSVMAVLAADSNAASGYALFGLQRLTIARLQDEQCPLQQLIAAVACTARLCQTPVYPKGSLSDDVETLGSMLLHTMSGGLEYVDMVFFLSVSAVPATAIDSNVARLVLCTMLCRINDISQSSLCARLMGVLAFASHHPRPVRQTDSFLQHSAATVRAMLLALRPPAADTVVKYLLEQVGSSQPQSMPLRQDMLEAVLCALPAGSAARAFPSMLKDISTALLSENYSKASACLAVAESILSDGSDRCQYALAGYLADKSLGTALLKCLNALCQQVVYLLEQGKDSTVQLSRLAKCACFLSNLLARHVLPKQVQMVLAKCFITLSSAAAYSISSEHEHGCELLSFSLDAVFSLFSILGACEDQDAVEEVRTGMRKVLQEAKKTNGDSVLQMLVRTQAAMRTLPPTAWGQRLAGQMVKELKHLRKQHAHHPMQVEDPLTFAKLGTWLAQHRSCCQVTAPQQAT